MFLIVKLLLNVYNAQYWERRMVYRLFLIVISIFSLIFIHCLLIHFVSSDQLHKNVCNSYMRVCVQEKTLQVIFVSVKDGGLKQIMENHFFTGPFIENHPTVTLTAWTQTFSLAFCPKGQCNLRMELVIRNCYNLVFRLYIRHFLY